MIRRRRHIFRRVAPGVIEVNLSAEVLDVLVWAAEQLHATVALPGSLGFARLFARVDESAAIEDPAVTLSRQLMLEDIASIVTESAHKRLISDDEAEAWFKVLGMTLARRAAELHVTTDEARASLSDAQGAMIGLVQVLQLHLITVLDTGTSVNS